jgi:hypothetical protein
VIHPEPGSDATTDPPALVNKRLFAFADNVAPDGIKVDTEGNVYGGCFDGVHVGLSYFISFSNLYTHTISDMEQKGSSTREDFTRSRRSFRNIRSPGWERMCKYGVCARRVTHVFRRSYVSCKDQS